ncbi:hypothetical protein [Janibacter indicus]|uniref:hypothetical protein n=1 Tax=Janibacter indicus TaxID=857417 RepID=UPI003D9A27DE
MSTPQISRRNVAKGIAWTAPAITIAAAAPSLAASETEIPSIDEGRSHGTRCQGASQEPAGYNKGYRVFLAVEPATAPAPVLVSVVNGSGKTQTVVSGPIAVADEPGVYEYVVEGGSSATWLDITYTIGDGPVTAARIQTSPHCAGYQY